MKSFTIGKNDAGRRLDKFIEKAVPALPKSLAYKYIRIKRIKLNSKRADIAAKLCEGDVVDMYISDEFFAPAQKNYDFLSASKKLSIVYEDENRTAVLQLLLPYYCCFPAFVQSHQVLIAF